MLKLLQLQGVVQVGGLRGEGGRKRSAYRSADSVAGRGGHHGLGGLREGSGWLA